MTLKHLDFGEACKAKNLSYYRQLRIKALVFEMHRSPCMGLYYCLPSGPIQQHFLYYISSTVPAHASGCLWLLCIFRMLV